MSKQTKEDLIIDWNELEAYRILNGQSFDFGTGLITWDAPCSEDVYWKIEQQNIENIINDMEKYKYISKRKTKRRKYKTKDIDIQKLKKLIFVSSYFAQYNENKNRYCRIYLSGCRKYAKWLTNRVIRHSNDFPLRGNGYRRVVGYWDILF